MPIYIPGKILLGKLGKQKSTGEKTFQVFNTLFSSLYEFVLRKINIQKEAAYFTDLMSLMVVTYRLCWTLLKKINIFRQVYK